MRRLTLFAKGNVDVHDTLHSFRLGDEIVWNGVNEIVRERHPGWTVRVRHETSTGSGALMAATGVIPADLAAREVDLGAFPAASQFSTALFDADCEAAVLTIQPDVMVQPLRHRRDGYLFYPDDWWTWPSADQDWLRTNFERAGPIEVEAAMTALARIIERRRAGSPAPILIYNVSSALAGDQLHSHAGMEDILSTRIRRFNLALIDLSQKTNISVIDVDAILARAGADRLKLDALHMTAEGCRLVTAEVVRVLDDLGLFSSPEAAS